MTASIILRPGTATDCPTALTVIQQAFAPYADWLQPESGAFRETVESLTTKLATNELIVAESEQIIVGLVYYTFQDGEIYFFRLAVLPAYQGQGIARQLVGQVEARGREAGCTAVTLGVRLILEDNIRYFHALGFRERSRHAHEGYSEPTYMTMAKELPRE